MLRATADKIINLIKNFQLKEEAKKLYTEVKGFSQKLFNKAGEKAGVLSSRFIFSLSAGLTAALFLAILPAGNLDFGYKLVCDGEAAGIVAKKSEAVEVLKKAQEELKKIPTSKEANKIEIVLTIANKEMIQQGECIENAVIACYDGREDCYGIYADGVLAAALATEAEATALLEEYKNEYKTEGSLSLSFNKAVEIKPARAVKEDILSKENALAALKAPEAKTVTYTVKAGDTLSVIAQKNGLSLNTLLELNPGISAESIKENQTIYLSDTTPLIAVRETKQVTETETVQFETENIEDSSAYEGTSVVVANGVLGEKEVEYEIVYENGIEVSKSSLKETVIKEPVTATVKVGTMPRPKTAPTGTFTMPYYGTLTSRYGSYRSRGTPHTGIDLAGPAGGNIVAADGGTVSFAGWNNSYGYLVKIKHDNGYETYYAHCSKLMVSTGDKVYQGQVIGLVGSTGNSSGPHLHFELRKNGSPVNPYNYFN